MRFVKKGALALVALIVMIGIGGFLWLRSSLPDMDGTITVSGPNAPITIARDSHGVPHIDAASDNDLYFGMGFVHAQDRLWQMEMNRRIGHGRLAEVVGKDGLSLDRYFRTLGFSRKAESAFALLPDDIRAGLEAYAAGVNAYIAGHSGAWPPEFILTGVTPEPWRPVDTLVWQKLMWLDLSGNMRTELARAQLLARLSPEKVASIYAPYPGDTALPLPKLAEIYAAAPLDAVAEMVGPEKSAGYGSNNWVISGAHTKSGKPLLANDPHLGLTTPSIWYLVRLHNRTDASNLVGVSFPGTPSIILGRNDRIAWGFTNTGPDSQDLFIEKLVNGGQQYLTPDGPADFITRTETIHIKGADDQVLTVRETRHGPVLEGGAGADTDFLREGYVLSLGWTALMDQETAVIGLLGLAKSHTFEDFKAAGHSYMGPEQNMVYADTDGNIGYYAPALVPVRHADNTIGGRLPSPGWLADYDWQGFIPYAELPTRFNPESGVIATANEKIVDDDYPHFITGDWALPYRGNRIRHLLAQTDAHDTDSFKAIQADTVSDMAAELTPYLVIAAGVEDTDIGKAMLAWQGDMATGRAEPLIFFTWMRQYQKALMGDELGDLYPRFSALRPQLIKSSLYWSLMAEGKDIAADGETLPPLDQAISLAWCDDVYTGDGQEVCQSMARATFDLATKDLAASHGEDWTKWQWADVHILHQDHRPFSQVEMLRPWFELSAPVAGANNTINVAGVSQAEGSLFQSRFGPSYRGIFDLANMDASLFVQPTGQSGNPFSAHYDDLFPLWRTGEYFTIPTDKVQPADTEHVLVLIPAGVE